MKKNTFAFVLLPLGILFLFLLNLYIGSVRIPFNDVLDICLGRFDGKESWRFIVLENRLPQAITAMFCGGALSVSGLMLQTAFQNPLAGPDVFGINAGAGLGVALVMLLLGVWCGYGVIDILFKQVAKSGTAFAGNLLVAFCLAGILMFGYLFAKGSKWTKEGIVGGMILGCLNFLNIVTYISAHQIMKDNPTLVFAGMNIGVIVLGTLIGAAIFKEKISSINAAGISIAICSIACLFYWPQIRSLVG